MQLAGSLRRTTLGDVLGALFREQATGCLELTEEHGITAGRVHRIELERGLVCRVVTPVRVPRLGELLAVERRVAPGLIEGRLANASRTGRVGDVLVESKLVDRAAVEHAARLQQRERLDALFTLSDARITFRVAGRRDRSVRPLLPGEFLHGRPRRRDGEAKPTGATEPHRVIDAPRRRALGLLGLREGAERGQVQRAFRRLAAQLHPDRFPSASREERAILMRRFAEISAAYHVLVA